jgi:hypothetical protein
VSSTKDNGYLADRMYVIDYGSLWNTDGYIGMFNNRSNTECVHLKTVFYESKPIFASTSIFIALITTCSNYNYNISVQYNQSLYEMNMFNDIQKQTFFPKLWMPNINDLIFEAYASFITTIQS